MITHILRRKGPELTLPTRKARPQDADAITALVHAAYSAWVDVIGTTPGPMLDDYAALITNAQISVSEDHRGICALLVLIAQDDAMLLDNLAVRPDLHGTGLGSGLLILAEEQARAAGFSRIRLYAHEKMANNIALYKRHGYTISHRVTERGLNRVYMEKPLPDEKPLP